jgi:hypothetical protein
VDILAMLDTGSNTSLLSYKSAATKLGLSGPQAYLTMNLAGGAKKSKVSEIVEITMVSPVEEDVKKPSLYTRLTNHAAVPKQFQRHLWRRWRNTLILNKFYRNCIYLVGALTYFSELTLRMPL